MQRHRDKEREILEHKASTIRQYSVPIFITGAVIKDLVILTEEVSQPCLIDCQAFIVNVYFKAPGKLHLGFHQFLKRLKHLYGLTDSWYYWYHILTKHVCAYFKMKPTTTIFRYFWRGTTKWPPALLVHMSTIPFTQEAGNLWGKVRWNSKLLNPCQWCSKTLSFPVYIIIAKRTFSKYANLAMAQMCHHCRAVRKLRLSGHLSRIDRGQGKTAPNYLLQ